MIRDVLITIRGLHDETNGLAQAAEAAGEEVIETVSPGEYFFRNGKHYILYEECIEGSSDTIKNRIKITPGEQVEILKNGIAHTHMIFAYGPTQEVIYHTPYGQLLIGLDTHEMKMTCEEDQIHVEIEYGLEINHEPAARSHIDIQVVPRCQ